MKILLYQFHLKNGSPWSDNNYDNYWNLSVNSCKHYAKKYGYDYILDYYEDKQNWNPWFLPEPHWEQFRSIEYLKIYDAVLFVDTDILIKPNSPDIVKEYKHKEYPLIINTKIGNEFLGNDLGLVSTISLNTGVVLWYKKSKYINDLYNMNISNYYHNNNIFILGDFLEKRKNKKWWQDWNDFMPFIGKLSSGYHNEERFLSFITEMYIIPKAHLHEKYNYRFTLYKKPDILSEDIHFIHYANQSKKFMKQHYNLIMEQ
jgi:hypothetical protein